MRKVEVRRAEFLAVGQAFKGYSPTCDSSGFLAEGISIFVATGRLPWDLLKVRMDV